ncbi:hypothetical protein VOLCADRAFT_96930 [Volvox carteri f. nagariensis]|uniref:Uncharacterized protein n=1 Tax=Volvox carteri f. nagariensis TaxID=3068 RepID=D8UBD0_VOLCA|nr:uncharacterized protein VOLCADRAFT_96930 [Volvox carteri f. nagariensis]EFJ42981.1 hypothetical protein VOLCADRAFT_96930 [Volvox carteri f. nagariensis]|eukprot:XP_002956021.1 hypothetical protein VOLCADRAFT_96930 [Volvox carteri f. nagariensis]
MAGNSSARSRDATRTYFIRLRGLVDVHQVPQQDQMHQSGGGDLQLRPQSRHERLVLAARRQRHSRHLDVLSIDLGPLACCTEVLNPNGFARVALPLVRDIEAPTTACMAYQQLPRQFNYLGLGARSTTKLSYR